MGLPFPFAAKDFRIIIPEGIADREVDAPVESVLEFLAVADPDVTGPDVVVVEWIRQDRNHQIIVVQGLGIAGGDLVLPAEGHPKNQTRSAGCSCPRLNNWRRD